MSNITIIKSKLNRGLALTQQESLELYKYIKVLKQQPKTGHWRPIYQGDEIIDYRCSECEFGNTFGKSTHGMNYCPHCGAKMEVDK